MDAEHKKQLEYLCRMYGSFEVVKAISENVTQECVTTYADNPGAVIHRDRPILEDAVKQMQGQHILRSAFDLG